MSKWIEHSIGRVGLRVSSTCRGTQVRWPRAHSALRGDAQLSLSCAALALMSTQRRLRRIPMMWCSSANTTRRARASFSQRPFVALPFSYAAPLFETAPPVSQRRAQDALTVHKISNIKKHVPVLRQPGFRVDAGAAELEAWAEHRLEPLPLLDTRAIRSPCQACGGDALMPGSVGASMQGVREEEVAAVGHAKASGARADAVTPSGQTRVVYACAASLFNNHRFPLADAIRVGEERWARVSPSTVRRVAEDLECGSDAEV